MQLHYSSASPYVRKVLVIAIETNQQRNIAKIARAMTPVSPDAELNKANPLGKIPALVLADGTTLYDSRVICEYLDSLHEGAKLFPAGGPARWTALRRQALGDGILDAAVLTRYETFLRPPELRWADWVDSQKEKIRRGLSALDDEAAQLANTLDIGTITIACTLGYLDFRYADDVWRERCPQLANCYAAFAKRPSMQQTVPA